MSKIKLFKLVMLFVIFWIYTFLCLKVDYKAIGPNGSSVGFSKINLYIHNLVGVNMIFYYISDWMGFIPILFAFGFAVYGFIKMISKGLKMVNPIILFLGGLYILIIIIYILFEIYVINYRPILINGYLEASYPSSHIFITILVMYTSTMVFKKICKNSTINNIVKVFCYLVIIVTIIFRFISGVHWLTDIIGGILLSICYIYLYYYLINFIFKN